jgi:hypothetical protein
MSYTVEQTVTSIEHAGRTLNFDPPLILSVEIESHDDGEDLETGETYHDYSYSISNPMLLSSVEGWLIGYYWTEEWNEGLAQEKVAAQLFKLWDATNKDSPDLHKDVKANILAHFKASRRPRAEDRSEQDERQKDIC